MSCISSFACLSAFVHLFLNISLFNLAKVSLFLLILSWHQQAQHKYLVFFYAFSFTFLTYSWRTYRVIRSVVLLLFQSLSPFSSLMSVDSVGTWPFRAESYGRIPKFLSFVRTSCVNSAKRDRLLRIFDAWLSRTDGYPIITRSTFLWGETRIMKWTKWLSISSRL